VDVLGWTVNGVFFCKSLAIFSRRLALAKASFAAVLAEAATAAASSTAETVTSSVVTGPLVNMPPTAEFLARF